MKLKKTFSILLAGLLCVSARSKPTENAFSLPMTNIVEIERDAACEMLKDLDGTETGISKHLLFDGTTGQFKGVLHDTKTERVFIFDSSGLLNLIVKDGTNSTVNIFNTRGEWLYVVKDNKHLFDATGRWKGVITSKNERIVFIKAESADETSPKDIP